ncbi:Nucleotide-binding universal stress protein, UspA family [Pricia antarctica]|uniref:Nucleotide-binding universal stress protein, UspA family n=1 Tax=Pricia antarctica TaxID=641691 RepID=A0A1G7B999_9FLAO|nr:universal stress protein [Pricia antarctica]SDE23698.1 Nucleotide-binding universal stress protein, UspA family [Pricia antarctica]
MKCVLLVTDFSANARNALNYGTLLFERIPTVFLLLNIHKKPADNAYEGDGLNFWEEQATHALGKFLKEVKSDYKNPKHSFTTIAKPLPFANAIKDVVDKNAIDLILLPTKGPRGARETFLGTDTVRAINSIKNVPIIVVPNTFTAKKPAQIVFSTNFERAFQRNELDVLVLLTKSLRCKLKIVQIMNDSHLDEFQKLNKDYLTDIFNGLEHSFQKIKVETSETEAINEYVKRMDGDMISLVNHRYNFLQKIIQENVVKKVTFNSEVPILVLPELVSNRPISVRTVSDGKMVL